MRTPYCISCSLVVVALSVLVAQSAAAPGAFLEAECLSVPSTTFTTALKSTLGGISDVLSVVSQFSPMFQDFRVANAIDDCSDLLDLSSDELSLTLSSAQTGKASKTKDLGSDLKTWLSAALVNQDTCMEGFDGTDGLVKSIISESLGQVTSLLTQALNMVSVPDPPRSRRGRRRLLDASFPSWIRRKDRALLKASSSSLLQQPDAVVALDGTGNFTRIMDAVAAAPDRSQDRFLIYVKKGVYHENVEIKRKKMNIVMYGDGIDLTVITANRSVPDGWTTYRSATFAVTGAGFIARDMTFENTAGPLKHQAVAFRSDSDLSALFRCAFRGYQDTLYAHSSRQFYRECTITGTVDFIFGDAIAVFQSCLILVRKGLDNQKNTVTAQGRKDPGENTGFSIQQCNISADSELLKAGLISNSTSVVSTFLGRPWKKYSRTVVMETYISSAVRKEGWLEWNGDMFLDTIYYAEYMNSGPGAELGNRVKWPGYHVISNTTQAKEYTVSQFIQGDLWLPETGVRYNAGLTGRKMLYTYISTIYKKVFVILQGGISKQRNDHKPQIKGSLFIN